MKSVGRAPLLTRCLTKSKLVTFLVFLPGIVLAEFGEKEPTLFPAGSATADTLRAGETLIGPPWGGWIAHGISDHVTLGWDYPAALFAGLPAVMLRYSPMNQDDSFRLATEAYIANWGSSYIDKRNQNFQLEHQGVDYWLHLSASWKFSDRFRLHAYGGYNYATYDQYSPYQGASFPVSTFTQSYSPDFGITFEWDIRPSVKFFANIMTGNSFYFVDQVDRKSMAVYAFDFAPFSKDRVGFLRTLRIELAALWLTMPIAGNYNTSLALPLYPWAYWQFNW